MIVILWYYYVLTLIGVVHFSYHVINSDNVITLMPNLVQHSQQHLLPLHRVRRFGK